MNLAAGYIEAKRYDEAIEILEELSRERLAGVAEMRREAQEKTCKSGETVI